MSCSQVTSEFTSEKFRLNFPHPSAFCIWRYTCLPGGRAYFIYRVLFVALLILLLLLDFLWIIGFGGAGQNNRITASLDASQLSLVLVALAYCLLARCASKWISIQLEPDAEGRISYKFTWFLYTCSLNAVYVCMIMFWVTGGVSPTLEQKLKNSIPGCLFLFDLCLTSVPLYFCHSIYIFLCYFGYLSVAALGLFLSYTFGLSDKSLTQPSNPTVWLGGFPLLSNGYADFTNVHRILAYVFGAIALALMVHCILLSVVIARDFLASLFNRSTDCMAMSNFPTYAGSDLFSRPSSSTGSLHQQERAPIYADNAAYDGVTDEKT